MSSNVQFSTVTPILRIFDVAKADAFYLGYLGFQRDWDHRFTLDDGAGGDGTPGPLYRQVSRGGLVLHLSEHHGDGSPGANVRVRVAAGGLAGYHAELAANKYAYLRPAIEDGHAPGSKELQVTDPFGNRITFYEDAPK